MASGSGETSVHRDRLIGMARFWDNSSATMGSISRQSYSLVYNGDAGVFTEFVSVYNQLAGNVGRWSAQGQTQMGAIADALVTAAKRYDHTESSNVSAAGSVGHQEGR
jgi:hypothetical protein